MHFTSLIRPTDLTSVLDLAASNNRHKASSITTLEPPLSNPAHLTISAGRVHSTFHRLSSLFTYLLASSVATKYPGTLANPI